jgi:hypothetical protein
MKVVRILILVLFVPTLAFAQYKIVLKNGKVIEGKYLHDDQANVYIESNGIQMNFKKETLDLDKMKELNAKVPAPVEVPSQRSSPATPKTAPKKAARVYTTEDLKQMKEIWDEGKEPTDETAATAQGAVAPEVTQPPDVPQTSEAPQTSTVAPAAPETPATTSVPEAQSQPAAPVEPPVPAGPRDEKTIRDEIQAVNLQLAETEKRIQDLRSKGRVTGTWEKLVVKQKEKIQQLQQELKDSIAARKAAKTQAQQ